MRKIYMAGFAIAASVYSVLCLLVYLKSNVWDDYNQKLLSELRKANLRDTAPPAAPNNDWPAWRGRHRDGISAERDFLIEWPEENTLKKLTLWKDKTGEGYSSVAVADGFVYTIFQTNGNEVVVCWDAETGQEKWRHQYPVVYKSKDIQQYGNGPRATPTVDGEYVYTIGATGILYCLKTSDGAEVWMRDMVKDFSGRIPRWGVAFSPLVVGDLLYIMPGGTGGNSVAAVKKRTGEVAWKNLDDPPGYSSPVVAEIAGTQQILYFTTKGIIGVSPSDGKLYWRYPWTTFADVNAATPIVAGDYVFVSSGYGKGCALLKIENDGEQNFVPKLVYRNRRMKNHFSSCVLYKEHLYGFSDTVLTCLDFRTGKIAWTFDDRDSFGKGSLIVAGDHLIILGETGLLAVADATPAKIELKSALKISEERTWSLPVLSNGLLYVRDQQHIWCLNLRKPKS